MFGREVFVSASIIKNESEKFNYVGNNSKNEK